MAVGDVSVSFPKVYRVSPKDGTVSGGVTIEDGAMKFDGVDGYVRQDNVLNTFNPKINNNYSVSLWFKTNSYIGTNNALVSFGNSTSVRNYIWFIAINNGKMKISSSYDDSTFLDTIGTNTVNLNSWNNVMFMENGTHRLIYVNGILDKIDSPTNFTKISGLNTFSIGNLIRTTMGSWYNGSIDDVRIYNRALSQEEITQLYNQGRGQYSSVTDGLVAQYSGRDFAGTEAVPTKIYDTKEVGLVRQDTSFIDTAFSEMRVNANSKFLLVKGHKNQFYVTHIEEA
jgi:hypothetical protein